MFDALAERLPHAGGCREALHQTALADAGLANDEDQLALPAARGVQCAPQLGQHRSAADQPIAGRVGQGNGGYSQRFAERSDKAVATSRDGLDIDRLLGIVSKCLTQLADQILQRRFVDMTMAPDGVQQGVFADQLAGPAHQLAQHLEGPRCQLDAGFVALQPRLGLVDLEAAEPGLQGVFFVHSSCDQYRIETVSRRLAGRRSRHCRA
ncbi:hypothetical protein PEC18_31280 [Paucibacter sp. O1-1]|nr:hypothetical protein [Paucibacter sp. O1-1]MDA3830188.1 hypothetical protein [Paucibacter sp. O1-1]